MSGNPARLGQSQPASGRVLHALRAAVRQWGAGFLFQAVQLLGRRRVRHVQEQRRARRSVGKMPLEAR